MEDYPTEIEEQLTGFESSVGTVNNMVQTILSMPRNELVQKVCFQTDRVEEGLGIEFSEVLQCIQPITA